MLLHFKGTLCDDHLHMTAEEYWEHKIKEDHERQKIKLRKLANNPILTDEYKKVVNAAIINIDMLEYWRKQYIKERNKNNGKSDRQ